MMKGNKKIKKIVNVIEYIIVFLVIFINVVLIFQSVKNPDKSPNLFGKKTFVIVSGSMIPTINIGDVVIVNETNNINVGDIIAFRRESTVIVHRIVKEMKINGEIMYQTKGDNNNVEDKELVRNNSVEGVLWGRIPVLGRVLMWLYNHLSIVIIVLLAFLIIKFFIIK